MSVATTSPSTTTTTTARPKPKVNRRSAQRRPHVATTVAAAAAAYEGTFVGNAASPHVIAALPAMDAAFGFGADAYGYAYAAAPPPYAMEFVAEMRPQAVSPPSAPLLGIAAPEQFQQIQSEAAAEDEQFVGRLQAVAAAPPPLPPPPQPDFAFGQSAVASFLLATTNGDAARGVENMPAVTTAPTGLYGGVYEAAPLDPYSVSTTGLPYPCPTSSGSPGSDHQLSIIAQPLTVCTVGNVLGEPVPSATIDHSLHEVRPSTAGRVEEKAPTSMDTQNCALCAKPIQERFMLCVASRFYHQECLQCSVCATQLESSPTCFTKHGSLFCRGCYSQKFQTKCALCDRQIQSTDWVRRARAFVYHLACFSCSHCQRQLSTGEQFSLQENRLLCKQHYLELVQGDDSHQKQKTKRVRTTFAEEQLNILQQHFQSDSNPDGADLERIANLTGLSKRVTQVWFQNSRARQKKYQGNGKKSMTPNSEQCATVGSNSGRSSTASTARTSSSPLSKSPIDESSNPPAPPTNPHSYSSSDHHMLAQAMLMDVDMTDPIRL